MRYSVFQDFKESERVHGEIATFLENIMETIEFYSTHKNIDSRPMLKNLLLLTRRMIVFIRDVEDPATTDYFWTEMTLLVKAITYPIEANGLTPVALRLWSYGFDHIRQRLMRIERIAQTTFISTGYTLFDICVLTVIIMVILAKYSGGIAMAHLVISAVTLLFVYISLLLRDVDDPFSYGKDDLDPDNIDNLHVTFAGRTEVDPRPILAFYRRLAGWIESIEASEALSTLSKTSASGPIQLRLRATQLEKLPTLGSEYGEDVRRRFLKQCTEANNIFDDTDIINSSPAFGTSNGAITSSSSKIDSEPLPLSTKPTGEVTKITVHSELEEDQL